jgi:hypothetical protein
VSVGLGGSLCCDRWARQTGRVGEDLVEVASKLIVRLLRRGFDCLEGIQLSVWGLYALGVVDHRDHGHRCRDILGYLGEEGMLDREPA